MLQADDFVVFAFKSGSKKQTLVLENTSLTYFHNHNDKLTKMSMANDKHINLVMFEKAQGHSSYMKQLDLPSIFTPFQKNNLLKNEMESANMDCVFQGSE